MQKPPYKPAHFLHRLQVAITGIGFGFLSQRHSKIHVTMGIIACLCGLYFKITKTEWMILILSIFMVLITETINTAIEVAIDLQTKKRKMRAKLSKDLAAGAVLLASISALIIGYLIFWDRFATLVKKCCL